MSGTEPDADQQREVEAMIQRTLKRAAADMAAEVAGKVMAIQQEAFALVVKACDAVLHPEGGIEAAKRIRLLALSQLEKVEAHCETKLDRMKDQLGQGVKM